MQFEIKQGMNQDILKSYPDNHFDSIVTDPPYGIEFLGKDWDSNTGAVETWQECFRVLKPGGYLLAFSAARTYHHLATNIESVGFEIRDQLMWIYASGFPKAQDVGKAIDRRGIDNEWSGWKTALKPGHEPIVMARKPFKGSTIDNVLEYGTGALNIDATRIEDRFPSNVLGEIPDYQKYFYCPKVSRKERHCGFEQQPVNDGTTDRGIQGDYTQTGTLGRMKDAYAKGSLETHGINVMGKTPICLDCNKTFNGTNDHTKCDPDKKGFVEKRQPTIAGNNHPTIKPVELMKYLIKLVTPPHSKVLDPFCGSGSTGMAAVDLGHEFTGCELDPNYVHIAETRIRAWNDHGLGPLFE